MQRWISIDGILTMTWKGTPCVYIQGKRRELYMTVLNINFDDEIIQNAPIYLRREGCCIMSVLQNRHNRKLYNENFL